VHIENFTIVVSDYDEALAFYVGLLGFELIEDSPSVSSSGQPKRWVMIRPPGAATGIVLAKADGERQEAAMGNQTGGRVGFFLRVDDFDGTLRRLADAGVTFLSEPRHEPYGDVVIIRDVAGNSWDILGPRYTEQ